MDVQYDLCKYHGIHITDETPTIQFFHNHQRLVKESRQEDGMDPYPKKYIASLDVIVRALNVLIKVTANNNR
jgi:hypothetical protein